MIWSVNDNIAADKQGWAIFSTGGGDHSPYEIQRIDFPDEDGLEEPVFAGDAEAHEFVRRQAEAGDRLALAALEFLREHSPEEYITVTESQHENWA